MKLSTQETAHRFFLEIRQIKYYREGVILIWGLDFHLVMLTFPFCTYIYIYDIRLQIEMFFSSQLSIWPRNVLTSSLDSAVRMF